MQQQRCAPAAPAAALVDIVQLAFGAIDLLEKCLLKAEREGTLSDLVSMDLRSLALLRNQYAEKRRVPTTTNGCVSLRWFGARGWPVTIIGRFASFFGWSRNASALEPNLQIRLRHASG